MKFRFAGDGAENSKRVIAAKGQRLGVLRCSAESPVCFHYLAFKAALIRIDTVKDSGRLFNMKRIAVQGGGVGDVGEP